MQSSFISPKAEYAGKHLESSQKIRTRTKMAASSSDSQSPQIQIARLIQNEEERRILEDNAEILNGGTDGQRRRIRRQAKEAGYNAYADALEKAICTTEAEKQSLINLINECKNDIDRLVEELNNFRSGSN